MAPDAPPAAPAIEAVIHTDEFAQHGGSYVFDPATGRRTRVVEAPPATPEGEAK